MGKKYSGVSVAPFVYCSSSGDYFATVTPLDRDGQQLAPRRYWINGGEFTRGGAPRYLLGMVIRTLQTGDLIVFEQSASGARRYIDLRYGSVAELRYLLGIGGDDEIPPRGRTGIPDPEVSAGA